MLKIQCNNDHNMMDILNILNTELDLPIASEQDLANTILHILEGTRQIREGSKPGIDYEYHTYNTIKNSINEGITLHVIIPAGPKKPGNNGDFIDLAEYWFATILNCLAEKIRAIYPPGILFTLILEDATMQVLEPELPIELAQSYFNKFHSMLVVLGYIKNIDLVPESALVNVNHFVTVANEILPDMERFLFTVYTLDSNPDVKRLAFNRLIDKGWQGEISGETLNHYWQTFVRNYPEKHQNDIIRAIALYLSLSYARYKLSIRSIYSRQINAANAKRVPGVSFAKYDRIFYRTIPLSKTKTHIPFWRSRGIVELVDGEYESKLFPFNSTPEVEENLVTIINTDTPMVTAEIRIDILEK